MAEKPRRTAGENSGTSAGRTTSAADDWRALTPAQRMLSTNRPHGFYWAAAAEAVGFMVLGAVLMARSLVGGTVVAVIGLAAAAVTCAPAHWSAKHPDAARQGVAVQVARRRQMARAHPLYFTVVLPLLVAVQAATRFNAGRGHHSLASWLVPAVLAAAFGLTAGAVLVRRARRASATPAPA